MAKKGTSKCNSRYALLVKEGQSKVKVMPYGDLRQATYMGDFLIQTGQKCRLLDQNEGWKRRTIDRRAFMAA